MTVPRLRRACPVLLVADVVKAAAYYTDKLAFPTAEFWGEPPDFAIVMRGEIQVMLNQVCADDQYRPNATHDGRNDIYFDVAGVDALFAEFAARGADIVCEPEDQLYGMREFSVRDADGHLLAFGEDIPE